MLATASGRLAQLRNHYPTRVQHAVMVCLTSSRPVADNNRQHLLLTCRPVIALNRLHDRNTLIVHQSLVFINLFRNNFFIKLMISNQYKQRFSICQCSVQIFPMIFVRLKNVSVIQSIWEWKWAPRPVGWMMCFPLIASGLVRMLGASCVVCNNLLFLYSFNNLNLIFPYHSNVISWSALIETTSVAVNVSVYTFRFCMGPVSTLFFYWPFPRWVWRPFIITHKPNFNNQTMSFDSESNNESSLQW